MKLEIQKPWRAFNEQDNVSGYFLNYKGLTFCTIKKTGHINGNQKRVIICLVNSLVKKSFNLLFLLN